MCKCNFRVKVDLSKFYDDVRRSSWVYVDTESVSCVCHLQRHITKIFDIKKDFHLLLNTGEYLPPNEDARILKEDETIIVVPGTGLQKSTSKPLRAVTDLQCSVQTTTDRSIQPPQQQKQSVSNSLQSASMTQPESSDEENDISASMETTSENTVFLSMINESQIGESEKSESRLEKSSNNLEKTLLESETSPAKNKRKRVRRKRKSKSNVTLEEDQSVSNIPETDYKKPKIINSVTIPNGKHIRFGDIEKMEFHEYDSSVSNSNDSKRSDSKFNRSGVDECYWEKPATGSLSGLTNLLALRQSSTPITFSRKTNGQQSCSGTDNQTKSYETIENWTGIEKILNNSHGLIVDQNKHPVLENKARVNDVIGFKMLKMGNDYTPQVSEYIIAHVMEISSDKSTYTFKILGGKSEIQRPQGKFELETEDETRNTDTDSITLNWSQLLTPRLIFRQ